MYYFYLPSSFGIVMYKKIPSVQDEPRGNIFEIEMELLKNLTEIVLQFCFNGKGILHSIRSCSIVTLDFGFSTGRTNHNFRTLFEVENENV